MKLYYKPEHITMSDLVREKDCLQVDRNEDSGVGVCSPQVLSESLVATRGKKAMAL